MGKAAVVLNDAQRRVLTAVVDRVVPADDWPSASELGAVEYLEAMAGRDLASWWLTLTEALAALEVEARSRFGRGFTNLTGVQQDQLLAAKELEEAGPAADAAPGGGPAAGGPIEGNSFSYLCSVVAEAYYADPEHGANREGRSWSMIGYPQATLALGPGPASAGHHRPQLLESQLRRRRHRGGGWRRRGRRRSGPGGPGRAGGGTR